MANVNKRVFIRPYMCLYFCVDSPDARTISEHRDSLLTYHQGILVFEVCEEIVTLIIYDDECREVLDTNLTNGLHT